MGVENGNSTGVIPSHVVVPLEGNRLGFFSVGELLLQYRNNSFDYGRVSERAYFLSLRRSREKLVVDDNKNWADAEIFEAIDVFLAKRRNEI